MPLVILIIVIFIVMAIAVYPWPLLVALATLVIAYLTYSSLYFRGVEIQRHQGQNPEIHTRLQ